MASRAIRRLHDYRRQSSGNRGVGIARELPNRRFDKGVVGAASQCEISDCNIGAYRYSAIDCTITGCDVGFQRDTGYTWLNTMPSIARFVIASLGADYASGAILSAVLPARWSLLVVISRGVAWGRYNPRIIIIGCQTGVTGPAHDNYVVICQIGMQNTGSRNIIEGCDVGPEIFGRPECFYWKQDRAGGERSRTLGGTDTFCSRPTILPSRE